MKEHKAIQKRIKKVYKIKNKHSQELVEKKRSELHKIYSGEVIKYEQLIKRYRELLFKQKCEGTIYLSLLLGICGGFVFWIIEYAATLFSAESAEASAGIYDFIVLVPWFLLILVVIGIIAVLFGVYVGITYMRGSMNNNALFVERYEIELIKDKLKKDFDFNIEK